MSPKWYPVIDYSVCVECGACVNFCKNGVYDKTKMPSPVVIFPEGCIEGCHGCESICPEKAIEYVGDTKGSPSKGCDCGGSCGDDKGGN